MPNIENCREYAIGLTAGCGTATNECGVASALRSNTRYAPLLPTYTT
jgi:hypothetical protein